jgi:beta-1,4-N-acetylglucosaminyltransferase
MIFLTVGSTNCPFDRLIKTIDEAVGKGFIKDEVFGQIGCSRYKPLHFSYKKFIDKKEFDDYYNNSDLVIGHAGMGTIMMSLEMHKPLLISPRRKEYREHVNEHQLHTAQRFEQLKHAVILYELENPALLQEKISEALHFKPLPRVTSGNDLAKDIINYINTLGE